MRGSRVLPLLVFLLVAAGGCGRDKPTSAPKVATGAIAVEVQWESLAPLPVAAKIPVTKGKVRVSGVGMANAVEREADVVGGRLKLRIDGIPVGTRKVELFLLSGAGDTLWYGADETVNVAENLTATAILRPSRVGNTPPESVSISASRPINRIGHPFTFTVSATDAHDATDSLQVRWDFDGDGEYDTDWSTAKQDTFAYRAIDHYLVIAQVRDLTDEKNTSTNNAAVPPLQVRVIDLSAVAGRPGLDRDTVWVAIPGGGLVDLDGKASHGSPASLGDSLVYHWKHLVRYPGAVQETVENELNANHSGDAGRVRFSPKKAGLYAFSLSVEFLGVFSDPDTLLMQVHSRPPTARVTAPGTVRVGDADTLYGVGADPDDPAGATLVYRWRGADLALLSDTTSSTPVFVPAAEGSYSFALVVSDADPQESAPFPVNIRVLPANQPPVADAGPDIGGIVGSPIALDGSRSSDPNADTLHFTWTSAEGLALDDPQAERPTFTAADPGVYHFELVVNDGLASSRPDNVAVTLSLGNRPPVADAGRDTVVEVGQTVLLNGGASSDPDGSAGLSYRWTLLGGGILEGVTTPSPQFQATGPGVFEIELVVSDTELASAADTVKVRAKEPPRLVFSSNESGDYEIYSIALDGTERTNLSQQPGDDDQMPRTSPDGSLVAFTSNRNHSPDPATGGEAPDIWGMGPDGGAQRQLVQDPASWPSLAADGSLAFVREYGLGGSDVFVVGAAGKLPERVSDGEGLNTHPSWSPDSRRLVFAKADSTGFYDLYLVDSQGGELEQLTNTPGASETEPAWSPDGESIAYVTDVEGPAHIAVVALATRESRLLTVDPEADHRGPSWSPDGSRIAYVRSGPDGGTAIYLMGAGGADPGLLVPNATEPAWLPGR